MPPPANDQFGAATASGDAGASGHSIASSQVAAARQQPRKLLFALAGGHGVKHVFASGLFVLLPELKATLGLSNAELGTLATARSVAGGLANAPAGFLADRYRRHFSPMLVALLVFIGIFQFAMARSVGLLDATIWASILAVLFTAWHPTALGVLSQVFSDRRGLVIALHGTGASIGETLGPLIAGALLLAMSWQSVLQVAIVPALIAAFVVWLMTRNYEMESVPTSVRGYLRSSAGLLRNPQILAVLVVAGGFGAGQSAIFVFLPVYVREDLGQSTLTVGLYVALAQGVGIGAQPVMGYLLDRLGRRVVIVPALLLLGAALFGMYAAGEGPLFLIALAVAGAFLFSTTAMLVAAACDMAGDGVQATTVSLVYSALALFTGLGPLIAGLVADEFSVRAVFVYAGSLTAASGLLALGIRMRAP